ncbi:MAG TPA: NADP-dependent oxidoreductase [Polyangiales bacterium]|nr:NADP-dependent oxidoreductase [Polyangiales bacterium]
MPSTHRQLIFAPRPGATTFSPELFELREAPIPKVQDGQVLIRNLVISADPAQVGWLMSATRYAPKVNAGEVMRAWSAGHVVESRHPRFSVGDRVWGTLGCQDYALSDGTGLIPLSQIPADIALSLPLGIAGINGITAHLGIVDVCRTRAEELVVVSTAAGATGSAAVQIARNLGARVIGIAGGANKCRFVRDVLGAADCIDYKSEDVKARLTALCPEGVNVYFDNVGGRTLDAVLANIAHGGRIALCGATAQYAGECASANFGQILRHALTVQGIVMYEHAARFQAISHGLFAGLRSGQLHAHEDLAFGLENVPSALLRLFQGHNLGKQLVVLDGAAQVEPKLTATVN